MSLVWRSQFHPRILITLIHTSQVLHILKLHSIATIDLALTLERVLKAQIAGIANEITKRHGSGEA